MANIKRYTEKELLEGLYSKGAHADEIAQVSEAEFAGDPLSELAGSVKGSYGRRTLLEKMIGKRTLNQPRLAA